MINPTRSIGKVHRLPSEITSAGICCAIAEVKRLMQKNDFVRLYIMLRPACGHAGGFVRLEAQHGRGRMTLNASELPGECRTLRVLLLSGDADSGAVMDLGPVTVSPRRQVQWRRDHLSLPPIGTPGGYHTLILAADWPDATLLLYGWLTDPPACTLWQLREALRHYLSVPAKDSPAAPAPPPAPKPKVEAPPLPARPENPRTLCTLPAPENPPPDDSVRALRPLRWPEEIAELKVYFDALPPSAPFEMAGWRFVRVPLPSGQPAPYCDVGIRVHFGQVAEVAYALPGQPCRLPPGGLRGYHWQEGRNGQGYWVLCRSS